jgi:hypothetical protein
VGAHHPLHPLAVDRSARFAAGQGRDHHLVVWLRAARPRVCGRGPGPGTSLTARVLLAVLIYWGWATPWIRTDPETTDAWVV